MSNQKQNKTDQQSERANNKNTVNQQPAKTTPQEQNMKFFEEIDKRRSSGNYSIK
ncbi:hypothetical protein JSY36_10525 [Bacillus sp. H-16]|uniref:hypothetical protein n=1 Tax=Alteribacter salitolerans TaxID=2912333 RepID=UPI001966192C|nr:hypothetical protein [Alteribacter salitolerans]MBM7096193.1 hypothetical protein [Alteribacter salitolerans]